MRKRPISLALVGILFVGVGCMSLARGLWPMIHSAGGAI
jgi:hypothetical protein